MKTYAQIDNKNIVVWVGKLKSIPPSDMSYRFFHITGDCPNVGAYFECGDPPTAPDISDIDRKELQKTAEGRLLEAIANEMGLWR